MNMESATPQDEVQTASVVATGDSNHNAKVILIRIAIVLFILCAWEFSAGRLIDDFWLSRPSAVAARIYEWTVDGKLPYHTWITMQEMGWGFLIGSTTGIVAGVGLGLSRSLGDIINPFIVALYSLPKVAMGPLFILWFGIGISMKIALAAITVFFLVFWNAYAGIRQNDEELTGIVRLMGANRTQLIFKIIVPGAMAWIYTGLKLSVPYALIGAIVGEIIAANRGLGYLISYSAGAFDTTGVVATLIVLMAISMTLNELITFSERRSFRWHKTSN
jgi:NitT/TauT family transport system permease protein